MLRAVVVVSLGLGLVGLPHVAWLAALALVLSALLGMPEGWSPRRRARALGVQIRPLRSHHFHYCDACDEQWAHRGESIRCTVHWASRCPRCEAAIEPLRQRRTA